MSNVVEKLVTHTHGTPDGSVVVITGVPATVVEHEERPDEVLYDLDVADRLEALASAALASKPGPGAGIFIRWADEITLPPYDLEVRFRGPGSAFGSADLRFWENTTERINSAFGMVARGVHKVTGVLAPPPTVVFVGPGSLRIGLRSRHSGPLFQDVHTRDERGLHALQIIAEAPTLLGSNPQPDSMIASDPRITHAALRALEVLAPSSRDPGSSVELIPSTETFPRLTASLLTSANLPAIRARRKELSAAGNARQEIVLKGHIDKVSVDDQFHLRDVQVVEGDWGNQRTADVHFEQDFFDEVLDHFRKRAIVRLYGYRTGDMDSSERRLELTAIDPAEPVTAG